MAENSYPLSQVANELNSILAGIFTEYSEELQEKADKVTEKVAEDFAQKLKEVTPRSDDEVTPRSDEETVHMADTIQVTTKEEKSLGKKVKARFVHYGKWQVSHLLEFGWSSKYGKRVDRKPFVRPLFDENKEQYTKMYKEELEKRD